MEKEFRLDGFFPSDGLVELLWQSLSSMTWRERLDFVYWVWYRNWIFTTIKNYHRQWIKEDLPGILANFFTSIARRAQIQSEKCERVACSEGYRFRKEIIEEMIYRLELDDQKPSTLEALTILHSELAQHLSNQPWESGVIRVFSCGCSIFIDYQIPFPPLPSIEEILTDMGKWIVT
jgi:hypothetical protein